ncbi:hypothetical protein Tco_0526552 [Tanacetum coccineum]
MQLGGIRVLISSSPTIRQLLFSKRWVRVWLRDDEMKADLRCGCGWDYGSKKRTKCSAERHVCWSQMGDQAKKIGDVRNINIVFPLIGSSCKSLLWIGLPLQFIINLLSLLAALMVVKLSVKNFWPHVQVVVALSRSSRKEVRVRVSVFSGTLSEGYRWKDRHGIEITFCLSPIH